MLWEEMAFRALKGGDCEKQAYATKLIGKNERIASQKLSQEASIMPMGPSVTWPLPMRLGWPIRPDQDQSDAVIAGARAPLGASA
jgi:hypothetical protein